MRKKIIILICLSIYLASAIHAYKTINIAYSKGGRWEHISPGLGTLVMVLTPALNTSWSLQNSYQDMYANRPEPDNSFYEKIFQIHK